MNIEDKADSPLVSVYMPTHNRADLLPRAIESVLNQTYKNIELIVVDDGSTDNTQNVLKKYAKQDVRFKFYTHDKPKGACAARNLAIYKSKGVYVTGIDDDDTFSDDRIVGLLAVYDDQFSMLTTCYKEIGKQTKIVGSPGLITRQQLQFGNCIGNQVFIRRDRVCQVQGFDESMVSMQDYELWIRLVKKFGPVLKLKQSTYNVFIHPGERITNSQKRAKGLTQLILKHENFFCKKAKLKLEAEIKCCSSMSVFDLFKYLLKGGGVYSLKTYIKYKLKYY